MGRPANSWAQSGHRGAFRSVFLLLVMSRGPSEEVKRVASFLRERTEIACPRPVAGRCGRSWQAWRSRRLVGFLIPVAPIKPKGSSIGFHTLHPCLHSHDHHRQSLRFPAFTSPSPSSSHPSAPTSNGSVVPYRHHLLAWMASSVVVFSARGPRPRSGCCLVRTCRRRPTAMWCRSPTSTSVGS